MPRRANRTCDVALRSTRPLVRRDRRTDCVARAGPPSWRWSSWRSAPPGRAAGVFGLRHDAGAVASSGGRGGTCAARPCCHRGTCPRRAGKCGDRLAVLEPAQVVTQRFGRGVAQRRVLGEQLRDDRLVRPGDAVDDLVQRLRRAVHLLVGDRHRAVAGERLAPGDHLVHHDSERVEVAARIRLTALRLLRREVRRGAHDCAGLRETLLRGGVEGASNAEVGDLHPAVVTDEDVRRLDVTMHDAVAVGEPERGGHLGRRRRQPARG